MLWTTVVRAIRSYFKTVILRLTEGSCLRFLAALRMTNGSKIISAISIAVSLSTFVLAKDNELAQQNEAMFLEMKEKGGYDEKQIEALKSIFKTSPYISQGNPSVTKHPISTLECQKRLKKKQINYENEEFAKICGAKYMAPLYDPSKQRPKDAKACIDQFEFPNIPCSYPVVWVRADEAAKICQAVGKRLCDAHEWEGACAGALTPPEYPFAAVKDLKMKAAVKKMRTIHNQKYNAKKIWSYGPKRKKGICAMNSFKHKDCNGGNWKKCGSNTYPAGSFSDCKSSLEVYDLHGNAAEHMNLPLNDNQMASKGSKELGVTEMKGSWFIFDKFKAHADHCRWRAPFWHGTKLMHPKSHHNYHLGFRCCKSI